MQMIGSDAADMYWTRVTINYTLWYRETVRYRCISFELKRTL